MRYLYKANFTVVTRSVEQHTIYIRADSEDQANKYAAEVDLNSDSLTKTIDRDVMNSELEFLERLK